MKYFILFLTLVFAGCGGSSDYHFYPVPNDDVDEVPCDEPIADIGDPYYYPGDYGIDDGIVVINEASPPIVSIVINGVEHSDLWVTNKEYFAVEGRTIVGMSYFVEITYVNKKSCMIHWNPIYIGPQLIIASFPCEDNNE